MKKPNNIEQLFKDQLENFEVEPAANTWSNIKLGLGAATTGAIATQAASSTSWVSTIIAGAVITATAIGGYFIFDKQGEKQKNKITTIEQTSPKLEVENPESSTILIEQNKEPNKEELIVEKSQTSASKKIGTAKKSTKSINSQNDNTVESVESEKSIDEIIAESQAQFEANRQEAIRFEQVQATKTKNNTDNKTSKNYSSSETLNSESTNNNSETKINLADEILFINVFTPDLDGINDVFTLDPKYHEKLDNISVAIFSNSGKVIFEWSGLTGNWDGTFKDGSLAPVGTYFYYAILKKDNKEYPKKGQIIIKR